MVVAERAISFAKFGDTLTKFMKNLVNGNPVQFNKRHNFVRLHIYAKQPQNCPEFTIIKHFDPNLYANIIILFAS